MSPNVLYLSSRLKERPNYLTQQTRYRTQNKVVIATTMNYLRGNSTYESSIAQEQLICGLLAEWHCYN
jgi:hypothetical protein